MPKKEGIEETKSVKYDKDKEFTWSPEEFGFEPINSHRVIFTFKEFELRKRPYNFWLLRRILNKGTKTEILVKWYMKIKPGDSNWAFMLFTKGLE